MLGSTDSSEDSSEANPAQTRADAAVECRKLKDQAMRCRRLAGATYDRATSDALTAMADGFDASADEFAPKG